ncbi:hypothetical protein HanHA300_Chr03g0080511 [Helianthus annuus]|nr:hypothetical protein HanHA300_Chr03g0080511 [Helianthus annuus]
MKQWQRETVKEMGFRKLLRFNVSDVTANLSHFVIDMLDTENMRINIGDRYITVDKESVRKILGLSLGETRVGKKKKDEPGHPLKEKWFGRFDKVPVSFKNILDKIRLEPYEDKSMFKIDFVMLFISTMIVSTKNGSVMYNMLDWFSPEKEFKDHDWCQLILDVVKSCKDEWARCDRKEYFRGPLTYLVLLYLEATTCPGFEDTHAKAPINFWTHNMMS